MKSITIHGLDDHVHKLIQDKAKGEGLSLNRTIKKLLEESLGIRPKASGRHTDVFKEFCGIWSDEDLTEFEKETADLRQVQMEDWQ